MPRSGLTSIHRAQAGNPAATAPLTARVISACVIAVRRALRNKSRRVTVAPEQTGDVVRQVTTSPPSVTSTLPALPTVQRGFVAHPRQPNLKFGKELAGYRLVRAPAAAELAAKIVGPDPKASRHRADVNPSRQLGRRYPRLIFFKRSHGLNPLARETWRGRVRPLSQRARASPGQSRRILGRTAALHRADEHLLTRWREWTLPAPAPTPARRLSPLSIQGPFCSSFVLAAGTAVQMLGVTLLDERDRPLRPAIIWNDGRANQECEELERLVADFAEIVGCRAMAGFRHLSCGVTGTRAGALGSSPGDPAAEGLRASRPPANPTRHVFRDWPPPVHRALSASAMACHA